MAQWIPSWCSPGPGYVLKVTQFGIRIGADWVRPSDPVRIIGSLSLRIVPWWIRREYCGTHEATVLRGVIWTQSKHRLDGQVIRLVAAELRRQLALTLELPWPEDSRSRWTGSSSLNPSFAVQWLLCSTPLLPSQRHAGAPPATASPGFPPPLQLLSPVSDPDSSIPSDLCLQFFLWLLIWILIFLQEGDSRSGLLRLTPTKVSFSSISVQRRRSVLVLRSFIFFSREIRIFYCMSCVSVALFSCILFTGVEFVCSETNSSR